MLKKLQINKFNIRAFQRTAQKVATRAGKTLPIVRGHKTADAGMLVRAQQVQARQFFLHALGCGGR